ncbi:hypothetical protein BGZ65_002452, partial [Modicella reniformis]
MDKKVIKAALETDHSTVSQIRYGLHKRDSEEKTSPGAGNTSNKDTTKTQNESQTRKNITKPRIPFKSLAVVNSTTMTCNGRSDLCDLRYNQVTYPGTHNSGAYDF